MTEHSETRVPKNLEDYVRLAYVTEPIIQKLRDEATTLIDDGKLPLGNALEWAEKELAQRLRMDPPDGLGDLRERDRRAIYCFVMGYLSAIRF